LTKPIANIAASIHQRLLNLARERQEDFGLVLTKYGLERVLYRMAQSRHREVFVLKGALLFELWTEQRYRPTRDADFLAHGDNSPERFRAVFKEICQIKVDDDGITFDADTITVERITEDADYEGLRIKFIGYLDNARVPIQIDLGFGDVITPGPVETEVPSMLDLPKARLLTYPRESVVAEKFEAMISLGLANSRMKDFYDIWSLSHEFEFEGGSLSEAIKKTFAKRGTQLPVGTPAVFTREFFEDEHKKKQWAAFRNKNRGYVAEVSLETVCKEIERFVMPLVEGLNGKKAPTASKKHPQS
jgi:Nucleotidyl transferase AbiEii toxin, Type IV TA system